jgi:hypothetical protein
MGKANRFQQPLFGPWLAWEMLPDPVREQVIDVLAAICLEITEVSQSGQQTVDDRSIAEGTRARIQKSS